MIDTKACAWLIENGGVTTRYRVYRELLRDENEAGKIEQELLDNDEVKKWLKNLKPETPPQHFSMHHGSFDFCLENALLKVTQLGLHAGLPEVRDAATYYLDYIKDNLGYEKPYRNNKQLYAFVLILSANFLVNAGFKDEIIFDFLLESLQEMHAFVSRKSYDIYLSEEEKSELKGIPKNFLRRNVIKKDLFDNHGYCYPLIHDIIGLHKLYELKNPKIDSKIDDVIRFISNDEFHNRIQDGYGILVADERKYYAMGWDPKYPGWFNVREYMETGHIQRLLFFAAFISKYPAAAKTQWFHDLLSCLEEYRTENGTYRFPPAWFKETVGYAVMGHHLSFGENRRQKNWCDIESTLYMQLLKQNICC